MIVLGILALVPLVFVFGINPETASFDLARGLLITTAIVVVSAILSVTATGLRWWLTYR